MVQEATQGPSPEVSLAVTLFFAAFLVGMILCLAFEEKLHAQKSLIVGLFAVATLLAGAVLLPLPYGPYLIGGHEVALPVYIPAIDWGVITIILGASLFVDVTSRSGLFTWIAIRLTKASRGDPRKLLWYYGIMTVAFSAVLNNVTAMIIVGVALGRLPEQAPTIGQAARIPVGRRAPHQRGRAPYAHQLGAQHHRRDGSRYQLYRIFYQGGPVRSRRHDRHAATGPTDLRDPGARHPRGD